MDFPERIAYGGSHFGVCVLESTHLHPWKCNLREKDIAILVALTGLEGYDHAHSTYQMSPNELTSNRKTPRKAVWPMFCKPAKQMVGLCLWVMRFFGIMRWPYRRSLWTTSQTAEQRQRWASGSYKLDTQMSKSTNAPTRACIKNNININSE